MKAFQFQPCPLLLLVLLLLFLVLVGGVLVVGFVVIKVEMETADVTVRYVTEE